MSPGPRPLPLGRAVAIVSALACMLCGLALLLTHLRDQADWRRYYDDPAVLLFAPDACKVAKGTWPGSFDAARAAPHEWRVQQVPMRGTVDPPTLDEGEYLVTQCEVKVAGLGQREHAFLSLGPAFGASRFYLNGVERQSLPNGGDVELPLAESDLRSDTLAMTLISRRTTGPVAGLGSLIPPYLTADKTAKRMIDRFRTGIYLEQPVFRLGLALVVALFFAAMIGAGLDYADMHWIAVLAATIGLHDYLRYLEFASTSGEWLMRGESALNFLNAYALILFHFHQTRPVASWTSRTRAVASAGLLTVLAATAAVCLLVPMNVFFRLSMATSFQAGVATVGLTMMAGLSFRLARKRQGVAARRLGRYGALALVAATVFALEIYFEHRNAVAIRPVAQVLLLAIYAGTTLADLAARQKLYFAEREERLAGERRLTEVRAAARTAQMLAHDIRRPFSLVRVLAEQLGGLSRPEEIAAFQRRFLPGIVQAQKSVDGMLEDLVQLDEPKALALANEDLRALLADVVADVAAGRPAVGEVRLAWAIGPAGVRVDRAKIARVLSNIVENAVDAMGGAGTIRIETAATSAGMVAVRVHNTGSFVPAEKREAVFDFAYTQGKAHGSGLGLAIARRIVEAHGGTIRCESEAGQGTAFVLTLARAEEEPRASDIALPARLMPAAAAGASGSRGGGPAAAGAKESRGVPETATVVLLDDDDLQLTSWELTLRPARPLIFSSPAALLARLDALGDGPRPLVCVLDYSYAGETLTGHDVAQKIRARHPEALILLATDMPRSRLPACAAVDVVIEKAPLSLAALLGVAIGARAAS